MAQGTEMVYTVDLVSGGTVRVVMDSGSFHRGDCVAVEQQAEADQCSQAKQRLLDAQTEEEINSAAMVMNILCQD